MTATEVCQALRHDLKYAGFTIQNIEREKALDAWSAKAIHKDLFSTRRGKSCLQLVQEAKEKLPQELQREIIELEQTASELEPWRENLKEGALCQSLYEVIQRMLKQSERLLSTIRGLEG